MVLKVQCFGRKSKDARGSGCREDYLSGCDSLFWIDGEHSGEEVMGSSEGADVVGRVVCAVDFFV